MYPEYKLKLKKYENAGRAQREDTWTDDSTLERSCSAFAWSYCFSRR